MNEMIERVAEALCEFDFEPTPNNISHFKDRARAAIEAMREPTEEMCEEVEHASRMGGIWSAKSAWQAMIDAALAKAPSPAS